MLAHPLPANTARLALLLALAMAAVVGTALGFEHIGGYIPCKLCLGQRVPYYVGVPVLLLAAVGAQLRWPPMPVRLLLWAGAALMAYGAYLGVYHAGVEWGFWPGPTDCVVTVDAGSNSTADLLKDLDTIKPPSCDKAAGRFLGLSFAGWNVFASTGLLLALMAVAMQRQT
jgi:disulfide bond formation protein DsbB